MSSKQAEMFGVRRTEYSADLYPLTPGYKREGTSKEAALSVKDYAETLTPRCLEVLRIAPATTDEIAAALGESVLSIRPRISELVSQGKVIRTDNRRKNASGKSANVWKIAG